ncbi:ArsR/SmtB family transcription factor [Synoicihabitans lomoniglobus]|uniref:Metalloregulator ArsR/SmtB family transcription factor n=1 Tax=Synoicihabitans lomoniglobus TaxID=2909285 RepID=A0AAF0CP10_9BACT|nr:metalloregulator ArsR/SmtB family transcription factor [Opitutaceae bacterium LMO-M01]WED65210.1 metalloregulator ArsR/SmtB family transcription factor [Opitutaceae bacterium LMO-M01]
MKLLPIYECLRDPTRLRLLHLLQTAGPLCVCHLQHALNEPQVKISKHLAYLRRHGLVQARRDGQWMHYRLVTRPSVALARNLDCLRDCAAGEPIFARDVKRLQSAQASSRLCGPAS